MTNDEIRRKDQSRMTKAAIAQLRAFRHSGFGFLSSFVIRHSTTYAIQVHGPNACGKNERVLSMNHPFVLVVVLVLVLYRMAWLRGRGRRRARARNMEHPTSNLQQASSDGLGNSALP